MHDTGYKSALARRVCRYSDARPPRKTDGIPPESEIPPHMRGKVGSGPSQSEAPLQGKKRQLHYPLSRLLHQKYASVLLLSMARHKFVKAPKSCLLFCAKPPRSPVAETGAVHLRYGFLFALFKRSHNHLRGFLIAACAAARRAIGTRKGEQLT